MRTAWSLCFDPFFTFTLSRFVVFFDRKRRKARTGPGTLDSRLCVYLDVCLCLLGTRLFCHGSQEEQAWVLSSPVQWGNAVHHCTSIFQVIQVKKMSQPDQGGVLLWTLSEEFQIREGRPSFCPSVDSSDFFNDISIFQRKCMQAHSKKAFDQHAKSKKHLQAGILFICTCFAWVMTLKWGCCKAEEGVGQRNGGNTHTHITDNRKKPIEFTLQNHEFWRKKPRMRIDYKKVMKANLLDFFESVRICGWRWRHHPPKFVDLHLTGPDETAVFAGHQDAQKEAQEAPKMSTVKEAVKEKQEVQVGIWDIWVLVCHMRAILIDNVWLDIIFGDFHEILKVYHFIIWADGLTKSQSTSNPYKGIKGCIARLAQCGTSAVYIASILHCLTFLSCKTQGGWILEMNRHDAQLMILI